MFSFFVFFCNIWQSCSMFENAVLILMRVAATLSLSLQKRVCDDRQAKRMILFPLYNGCPVCSKPTKLKPDPFGLHIRLVFSVQKSDHIDLVGNVTKDLGQRKQVFLKKNCLKFFEMLQICQILQKHKKMKTY